MGCLESEQYIQISEYTSAILVLVLYVVTRVFVHKPLTHTHTW